MELFLHIFFHIEHMSFWLEVFFVSIENFPEWKTALKYLYDTNKTLRILHFTLKYIFFYAQHNLCIAFIGDMMF